MDSRKESFGDAPQVEALGLVLADADVPIKQLSALLIRWPAILACSPEDLHRRVSQWSSDCMYTPLERASPAAAVLTAIVLLSQLLIMAHSPEG